MYSQTLPGSRIRFEEWQNRALSTLRCNEIVYLDGFHLSKCGLAKRRGQHTRTRSRSRLRQTGTNDLL